MPRRSLKNRQRELFARYVARGNTKKRAYALAGYKTGSRGNPYTLAKVPEVADRITELIEKNERLEKRGEAITVETITARLVQVFEAAYEDGEFNTARLSAVDLAKLHGLFEERLRADITAETITQIELVAGGA